MKNPPPPNQGFMPPAKVCFNTLRWKSCLPVDDCKIDNDIYVLLIFPDMSLSWFVVFVVPPEQNPSSLTCRITYKK